ncbi:hypothetical protein K505DRAFT_390906 [Melanomma pulvis-pyrius CBS 109.77]|uniref:Uncharacterized protein n=1 Tax=Melanomma pulvis-pyrius CBS 109.77 TaxID=1314802 RepID=A0A6A6XU04_9PLEO|nr:hypothetical protein K505DRAFT_390906 [Melanomma pulvis-pyrius CBS 109.77]
MAVATHAPTGLCCARTPTTSATTVAATGPSGSARAAALEVRAAQPGRGGESARAHWTRPSLRCSDRVLAAVRARRVLSPIRTGNLRVARVTGRAKLCKQRRPQPPLAAQAREPAVEAASSTAMAAPFVCIACRDSHGRRTATLATPDAAPRRSPNKGAPVLRDDAIGSLPWGIIVAHATTPQQKVSRRRDAHVVRPSSPRTSPHQPPTAVARQ